MSRNLEASARNDEIYERFTFGEDIEDLADEYNISVNDIRSLIQWRKKKENAEAKAKMKKEKDMLKAFIKEKLKVLKELGVIMSDSDVEHLKSLKSTVDIDNFAHRLIMTKQRGFIVSEYTPKETKLSNLKKMGLNIQFAICVMNHTRKEAAAALGVKEGTFNSYYYGTAWPGLKKQVLLVKFFKLDSFEDLCKKPDEFKRWFLSRNKQLL